jgi:formylglycine-generating enzyme required for sulfatase activity
MVLVVLGLAVGLYFVIKPRKLPDTVAAKSGEMVLVPAGPFKYGEKKEDASLPAYYIDKTEVTNQAYEDFSKATKHALPPNFPADKPTYPVVNVTIVDAKDFAKWAGERLPTAREWEKAARGTDGRMYPWGNEKDQSRASLGPNGTLHPATDFAQFAGPFRTVQMVGNVWELVNERTNPGAKTLDHFATLMKPPPTKDDAWYQIRGGSFVDPLDHIVIWDNGSVPELWKDTNIGFRCVKDAQ